MPAADMPGLVRFAESAMRGARILLTLEQAGIVAFQFRETARHRQWEILSLAVMANHIHLVVSAPSSITTAKLIGDFKAYTTRQLNDKFGKRRWWTERGSGRRLGDESAIQRAVNYVFRQEHPLIVWAGNSQESECDPDGAL
ncbi:MAG: transposase [Planctomycetes bacterium]|nr:transposase [Planctomycetota bacterium]